MNKTIYNYTTVSLPKELIDLIDKQIEQQWRRDGIKLTRPQMIAKKFKTQDKSEAQDNE